jgi:tyrosyl-tRNA synthetase
VEIGGTDQRFNLLAGRDLQRQYKQEPQDIITNPLIEGLDGRKMSSSWCNSINLFDSANEMFGKVMSLKDEFIIRYFTLATRVSMSDIERYQKELVAGNNPKDYKMKLAFEIVRFYHSFDDAEKANEYFINTFSKKEIPEVIPEIKPSNYDIITIMVESGLSPSKSEARRLIDHKGVKVNEAVMDDSKRILQRNDIVQKGKRFFVKVI